MSDTIPTVTSVSEIYPPSAHDSQKVRYEHLLAKFEELYGKKADFISRSPGRVNIIGEHIDYSLFPVLPTAVEADLLLAVRLLPNDPGTVRIANVNTKHAAREFRIPAAGDGDLEIDNKVHEWSNYFKSGLRGVLELLRKQGLGGAANPQGMQILCDGNVPAGAGLSSSAAFVCASALAGMKSCGVERVDKKELVNLAIVSERYVGVNSGGMDQSASVLGIADSALYISFSPQLTSATIRFPQTTPSQSPVFVIANSLVTSDKFVTGPIHYNLRVVECTLAAEVLAKKLNLGPLPADAGSLGVSLKGAMDLYIAATPGADKLDAEAQLELLQEKTAEVLDNTDGYTRAELARILGVSVEQLEQKYMTKFPIRATHFQLRARALHVYSEAGRVAQFHAILQAYAGREAGVEVFEKLGGLMDQSLESCQRLYECSCPELDRLCEIAKREGSYGSRLTGAGWGGCSVHMVPAGKVDAVRSAWEREFYQGSAGENVVVSKPGSGAVLFEVK